MSIDNMTLLTKKMIDNELKSKKTTLYNCIMYCKTAIEKHEIKVGFNI